MRQALSARIDDVLDLDPAAGRDELVEFLGTRLARYEIPTEIVIAEAIPRTPSGKPDLTAVRSYFAQV